MSGWFKRHTSMRGRLAILLVLLLVVPIIVVGWLGYRGIARPRPGQDAGGDVEVSAAFRMDEAVRSFQHALDQTLKDLAWRTSQVASVDAESVQAAFADLPESARPACVALLDGHGGSEPLLSRPWLDVLQEFAGLERARAGYVGLPAGGLHGATQLPASLYQVVLEPRGGGRNLLALRDVGGSSGDRLLASLPVGAEFTSGVADREGNLLASHAGSQWDLARFTPGAARPGAAPGTDFCRRALAQEAICQELRGELRLGAGVLRDLRGEPTGLAVVQADDRHVMPLRGRPNPLVSEVGSLVGWIALVGVLLALVIGWAAPHWLWSDIRTSTDTIFGSVERLRELVRRNSRALDEQSRVIKSLMGSVSALETASQSIAETSRTLAHSAEQSAWVSQSGNHRAEVSQRAVLDVRDRVEDISSQMEELERRCAAIGSLLGFIDHLSNETNTLSINATIQAVGSGSSGREFSLVAGEIRKLADLALDSTQDIKQLIEEIQQSSRGTLGATQEGCREVDKCLASFEELESAFARILRWVDETTHSAQGIEQSTARQSDALQSVGQSIEALEERARETVGNFHDVVEAADELAELGERMNDTWRVG